MIDLDIAFSAEVWVYHGKAAWHFVTLPKEDSRQIKFFGSHNRTGWGSVRVKATIGGTSWNTSLFPDSKADAYLLPIKADVRKKEEITAGTSISVRVSILA